MREDLTDHLRKALKSLGIPSDSVALDHSGDLSHGDYSTNVAMVNAKKLATNPRELAEKIVAGLRKDMPDFVKSVEVAGAGFINFSIEDSFLAQQIVEIAKDGQEYGKSASEKGKQVMVEYTDPNPFKVFHIGHLMANAIGESISRLVEYSGSKVIRACYQGDVGLHVAKTIWAIMKKEQEEGRREKGQLSVTDKVKWLGEMYVYGSQFDDDAAIQKEIAAINKKIFEKSDPAINAIYQDGRAWSLEYFDIIYKRLGTKFDQFFFESEVAEAGMKIVAAFTEKGVFEKSEGAIVFPGEKHGLHTRVFVTSQDLPTYETKELGLNTEKFKLFPKLDQSVIVTANEQNDYFKVLLKAFEQIDPAIAAKTKHISHGLMRFASGKMSSRKGNIIAAEDLLSDIKKLVTERIADREFTPEEAEEVSDIIAIAAIKYSILRQAIGGDVIFDSAQSISFEGDSGPYLQYSAVRAAAVLEKAQKEGMAALTKVSKSAILPETVSPLEKLIARFPDIVERARIEYAPQHVAGYLITLAGAFNNFYANQTIADKANPLSPYYVSLTQAFLSTMKNGLWILGIKIPSKM